MGSVPLTKSLFQAGRQCRKRLWLEVHRPELRQWSSSAEARADDGNRLGKIARQLFGLEVGNERVEAPDTDFERALEQTRALLTEPPSHRPVLFEAAFEHDGVRVRIDVLMRFPLADRLIEMKAGSVPTEDDFWNCAIQTWTMRGAARPVRTITLALVEENFVHARQRDFPGLLALEDCTEKVESLLPHVPFLVAEFKTVMEGPQPNINTGRQCGEPYDCPFLQHCRASAPTSIDIRVRNDPDLEREKLK